MRKKGRSRIIKIIGTMTGILFVVALFGIAMLFPHYYNKVYDENTLNHIVFTDTKITTYEASYDSFTEKLHAIARGWSQKSSGLSAVRTNELEQRMDQGELTKIVRSELNKLYKFKIITNKIVPKKKNLVQCERYTIYETKETNGMKGISLWKLVYENTKRKTTLYLDEEYHKIYYLELSYKESVKSKTTTVGGKLPQSLPKKVYSDAGDTAASSFGYISDRWPLMIQYYDIPSYQAEYCDNWVQDEIVAVLEFDLKYQINFLYDCSSEGLPFRIGLPLPKMIQF